MDISGVSSYGSYTSYTTPGTFAENVAESAIEERQKVETGSARAAATNITSAKSLLNISDGALAGIQDYLQSIRELAVQATNSIYTDSERQTIQDQIEQYKQGITDIANNTTFNTHKLLDGTDTEYAIATDSTGDAYTATTGNATLDALGITDFDVTSEDYDISTLDNALDYVSSLRASGGAQTNALSYYYNSTQDKLLEEAKDADKQLSDMIEEYQKRQKEQQLEQYRIHMQKKTSENQQNKVSNLFV